MWNDHSRHLRTKSVLSNRKKKKIKKTTLFPWINKPPNIELCKMATHAIWEQNQFWQLQFLWLEKFLGSRKTDGKELEIRRHMETPKPGILQ